MVAQHTVPWMVMVWFMWVARKSSYLVRQPGQMLLGVMLFLVEKHWTAAMYFFLSVAVRESLNL